MKFSYRSELKTVACGSNLAHASSFGTQACSHVYMFKLASMLQQQKAELGSCIVVTETLWPAKPKIPNIWPFIEKVYLLLF